LTLVNADFFFENFLENEEKESVGWVKIWGMTSNN